MDIYRIKQPFTFTIFGASGDLAKLKIFPALFALAEQNRFPKEYAIVGFSRTKKTDKVFRKEFETAIRVSHKDGLNDYQEGILKEIITHVSYISGNYDNEEDFKRLRKKTHGFCSKCILLHIVYFSVPPNVFEPIIKNIAGAKKTEDIRLILEKPFGTDEVSARKLFQVITKYFEKKDLYLLDHYLGKKPIRSLIPLRHMNRILNLVIQGREISNIQISALELMGVGKRIGYFDQVGTVKDMVQSHLLQILALTTMSIPIKQNAESIQKEKNILLSSLEFEPQKDNIILGQYAGYKQEDERTKNSNTPTFAALKLQINKKGWHGVPIYLRAGKELDRKHTYMTIELKKFDFQSADQEPNRIVIELYPDEKLHIRLLDEDGATARIGEIGVSESIACQGDYCLPEHGLLLLDVIREKRDYFLSFPEILSSWHIIDQVLDFVEKEHVPIEIYKTGTCGPKSQKRLMKEDGFQWYDLHS